PDVRAGAEELGACAGEDDHVDLFVHARLQDRGVQLEHHLVAVRVGGRIVEGENRDAVFAGVVDHGASKVAAMPWPTPMHMVARPFLSPRARIAWSSVATRRAPLMPSGWPSAIAPPLTLTLFGSSWRSRIQASDCAANASLSSTRSRSPVFQPA